MSDEKTTAADAAAEHALAEADAARAAEEGVLATDEDAAVVAEDAAAAAEAQVQSDKDELAGTTLSAPQAASDGGIVQSDEQAPDPAPDSAPDPAPAAPEETTPEAPAPVADDAAPAAEDTPAAGTFDPSTPAQMDTTGLTPAQHTEEVPEGAFIGEEDGPGVVPSGIAPDQEQQDGGTLPPV